MGVNAVWHLSHLVGVRHQNDGSPHASPADSSWVVPGLVARAKRREDRAYFYTPTRKRQQVRRAMVREFVSRVFDGAAQSLRVHLVMHETLTAPERDELRRLIDELDEGF